MTTPTLVFLHGFLGSGAQWQTVCDAFPDYPTLAPDLPGHGDTPLPPHTMDFDWLGEWLCAWLDAHQIRQVVMVGYSMGGRLAWHFAARHPERLSGLVIESAAPGIREADIRAQRRAEDEARAARIRAEGLPAFVAAWYQQPLFRSLAAQPALLAQVIAHATRHDAECMARVVAELSPGRQPSLWEALPMLRVPTLLIAGAHDAKYVALLDEAVALMPCAERVTIPDAGHNVHIERSAAFAETLRAWLRRQGIMPRRD